MGPDRGNGMNRSVILAIGVGLATFVSVWVWTEFIDFGVNSSNSYPGYYETAEETQKRFPALSTEQALKGAIKQQPCSNQQSRDASDLCAQWRAANAAEQAARWTWWQMWFSLFGVVGLGITLWFNFCALRVAEHEAKETKGALAIAERNAEAAAEQVRISDDAAKRELRAYVTAQSCHVEVWREENVTKIRLEFMLKNSGKTTAVMDRKRAKFQSGDWVCKSDTSQRTIISPQGSEPISIECGTGGEIASLNIVARIFIEYRDYLDVIHTEDSFWFVGPAFPPPTDRTDYILLCHSKIDETIGRFLDPDGEAADERQLADSIAQLRRMQEAGVSVLINGEPAPRDSG